MYFLEVKEPFTRPPTVSISLRTLKQAFSASVSGFTRSPFIIRFVMSSKADLSKVINRLATSAKYGFSFSCYETCRRTLLNLLLIKSNKRKPRIGLEPFVMIHQKVFLLRNRRHWSNNI